MTYLKYLSNIATHTASSDTVSHVMAPCPPDTYEINPPDKWWCSGLSDVLQQFEETSKKMYQSCICHWWVGGGWLSSNLIVTSSDYRSLSTTPLVDQYCHSFRHISNAFFGSRINLINFMGSRINLDKLDHFQRYCNLGIWSTRG